MTKKTTSSQVTSSPKVSPAAEAQRAEFARAFETFRALLPAEDIDALQPLGPAAIYTTFMTVLLLVYQRLQAGWVARRRGA